MTAEQKARDMLERMGVHDVWSYTAEDIAELANLIAYVDAHKQSKYYFELGDVVRVEWDEDGKFKYTKIPKEEYAPPPGFALWTD